MINIPNAGLSTKTGVFLSHLGLGDLILMNGAIRYSASMVDKLYVICKSRNCNSIIEIFADNPSISVLECKDDDSDVRLIISQLKGLTHTFLSGCWAGYNVDCSKDISVQFYEHLGFPIEIKKTFAYFNPAYSLEIPSIPYIFTHSSSSTGKINNFHDKWNREEIFIVDPNTNVYPNGHKWHTLAESYINRPSILSYVKLIENANEIHVTDSSFFWLSSLLTTNASKKISYDRYTGDIHRTLYQFT